MDLAVADLYHLLRLGLERGGHLLTAGEQVVVDRILGLSGEPARAFALLVARRTAAWPLDRLVISGVSDPQAAALALVGADLADHLVPWPTRAALSTRAELIEGCKRLGLSTSGRRAELEARLRDQVGWRPGRWVRLRHRGLLRRLEQWALLRPEPDRSLLVVERLGHLRWPDYPLTRGTASFACRRDLRDWEALHAGLPAEEALPLLRAGRHRGPGRLDLGGRLREQILEQARARERQGDLEEARRLYLAAEELLGASVSVRVARTLELSGRLDDALAHLLAARDQAPLHERVGIARAGRRLARRARRAWPPDPPLRTPRARLLALPPGPRQGSRPTWLIDGEPHTVEWAVIRRLAAGNRKALHAEGALWTTLFALLFADAYFLPIPGALPVRFLSGPTDLGTPTFRERRRPFIDDVLEAVRAGEAPDRVLAADARHRGSLLAGAAWNLADGPTLARVAEGLGGHALASILEALLQRGWRASAGLPDLVVLPGRPVRLDHAQPASLGPDLLLAEVKGPGDTVRDEQAAWFDHLLRAGAPVELWEVRPRAETPADYAVEVPASPATQ